MERRERYEEHLTDPATTLGIGANEWPEFLHSDFQEGDEATSIHEDRGAESASTDDLVKCLRRVHAGEKFVSRQMLSRAYDELLHREVSTSEERTRRALTEALVLTSCACAVIFGAFAAVVQPATLILLGARWHAAAARSSSRSPGSKRQNEQVEDEPPR